VLHRQCLTADGALTPCWPSWNPCARPAVSPANVKRWRHRAPCLTLGVACNQGCRPSWRGCARRAPRARACRRAPAEPRQRCTGGQEGRSGRSRFQRLQRLRELPELHWAAPGGWRWHACERRARWRCVLLTRSPVTQQTPAVHRAGREGAVSQRSCLLAATSAQGWQNSNGAFPRLGLMRGFGGAPLASTLHVTLLWLEGAEERIVMQPSDFYTVLSVHSTAHLEPELYWLAGSQGQMLCCNLV